LDTVAGYVRLQRQLYGWKQDTLASKANVSLSTLQRVERGEAVRGASLQKIAGALNLDADAFTRPRVPLGRTEALTRLIKSLEPFYDTVPVRVAPLRTETQLRSLAETDMAMFTDDLGPEAADDVATLREWLDLTSFIRATDGSIIGPKFERSFRVRRLYGDVMQHVKDLERHHKAVCLVGTYRTKSNHPHFAEVDVAVVAIRSRDRNPAASRITTLFAPEVADAKAAFREFIEVPV
jgi:transcriptional regulator with XRE-family HTH domain